MRAILVTLLILVIFVVGVVSQLPLALVTDRIGGGPVSFGSVSGTIWDGEARGISFYGEEVGDAALKVKFLPLLGRRAEAEVSFTGRGLTGSGTLGFDGDVLLAEDATGSAELARFGMVDAFGQTLRGSVEADIRRLAFSLSEGCLDADLSASTDAIAQSLGVYADRGFMMAGEGRCEGEALVIPLAGEGPDAAARAELQLDPRGGYLTRLEIEPKVAELGSFLAGAGFRREGNTYVIERGGALEARP